MSNSSIPYIKLKEICDVNQGLQIAISKRFRKPGVNRYFYITIQFLKDSIENRFYVENPPESSICSASDILVVRTGSTGVIVKGYEGCFHNNFFKVNITSDKFDSEFLYHVLNTKEKRAEMKRRSGITTIPDLNHFMFLDMKVPFLELSRQKEVSNILSTLDKKIDLNNQINAELESMAKLIYDYWFVQFDFLISAEYAASVGKPELEGKPYKSSGGKMVWSEELKREIPEGWGVGKLGDVFHINPKESLPKNKEAPYIGMTSVPSSGYMTEIPQRKPFGGGMKFRNNDVIVARITPCLENGKTALISLLDKEEVGFGSTEFIVLRGKEMKRSCFGSILARSKLFRHYAISKMTGTSGRKRVSGEAVGLYELALPPTEILEMYENMVNPFFEKMTLNSKENQELTSLRDWLLPMLMNGQVRVEG